MQVYASFAGKGGAATAAPGAKAGDDEDVPELVESFEATSKGAAKPAAAGAAAPAPAPAAAEAPKKN